LRSLHQFFRCQPEALDIGGNLRPFFGKKSLALILHQQAACTCIDEHAAPSSHFGQSFVHQLPIALQDRQRIDPVFSRREFWMLPKRSNTLTEAELRLMKVLWERGAGVAEGGGVE
jgi:hypothetical protein